MQKECVTIVTTKMEEPKNHGNANIKNYTPMACVKTVTLTNTIKWKDKKILPTKNSVLKQISSTPNQKFKNHLEFNSMLHFLWLLLSSFFFIDLNHIISFLLTSFN